MTTKSKRKSVILPVVLIILSIGLILGTTLAYFTDTRSSQSPVNFGKIEISVDDAFTSTIPLNDALPGDKITDKISFSKAVDSEDMYVRAKVYFDTDSDNEDIKAFVNTLNTYDLDIADGTSEYMWSDRMGYFYYLVSSTNTSIAYNVQNASEIVLSNAIYLPREMTQLDEYSQYMQDISLNVEIQAVQSYNVEATLYTLDYVFYEEGFGSAITNPNNFTFNDGVLTGLKQGVTALSSLIIPSSYSVVESSLEQPYYFKDRNAFNEFRYDVMRNDRELYEMLMDWYYDRMAQGLQNNYPATFDSGRKIEVYDYGDDYTVTGIGAGAFNNCNSLTSVIIPNSVTSIGDDAFRYCSGLTSIIIPDSVTSIGLYAFSWCSSLTSVTIGNSVTSIGSYAFQSCIGLISVTIPDGVTSIGFGAFNSCTGINTELIIPDSVINIDEDAFSDCSNLPSVRIGNGATSIGPEAFRSCTNLTSVTIGNSVTSIEISAFAYCSSLKSITIPDSVISIGTWAFDGCSSLTSITIPNGVTSIGAGAFSGCTGLTGIAIPDSVTSIGDSAFSGCTGLTSITIPDSVTSIEGSAFYNTSYINNFVTNASRKTFTNNEAVTGLTTNEKFRIGNETNGYAYYVTCSDNANAYICFGGSASTDGIDAHSNLSGEIAILDGTKILYSYAFEGCLGLTSITIPESVTNIGQYVFRKCSGLTSIAIPNSVTSIGYGAFEYCSGLTGVYIADLTAWMSIDFVSSSSNPLRYAKNLYLNDVLVKTLNIPATITEVKQYVFYGCNSITSITIPGSVASMEWYAFSDCSALTSINIESGVTSIGVGAFRNCSSLKNITIPGSVASIGQYAFENCSGLSNVTFEDTSYSWYVSISSLAINGRSVSISTPSTNATYFKSTYDNYYWFRGEKIA